MHYFLGMEVWQNVDGILLGQGKYVVEILKIFRMSYCKAIVDVFVTSKCIHLYILYCISLYPDVPIERIINIIKLCKVI